MKKNINFLKEKYIAHRGMHNEITLENTLLSFKKAIDNNYAIELDVHLLPDNNIIVFHDNNLLRMTGVNKYLSQITLKDLKNISLKNKQKIPLFKDVLKLVDGRVPLIIELKNDLKYKKLADELMKLLTKYKGLYAIHSFNPLTLIYFRKKYPYVLRGQLASEFREYHLGLIPNFILKKLDLIFLTKPDFISYDIKSLPNKKITKIRNKVLILGWTVKTYDDLIKASLYCDNLICENLKEKNRNI